MIRTFPLVALFLLAFGSKANADSRMALHDHMRVLWLDHASAMRMYIVSVAGDLPDNEIATQRLLRSQDLIGNAFADYHGSDAGAHLSGLMKEHVLIAGDVLKASRNGDAAGMNEAHTRWYESADEIASFLQDVDPHHFTSSSLKAALRMEVDHIFSAVIHRLQGNYEAELLDHEDIVYQMLIMADTLSDGIAARFIRGTNEHK